VTNAGDLRELDIRHLWHPYTDIAAFERSDFPIIERADGACLYDRDGREILDGISSWWCANLGHGHPAVVDAIARQARTHQHSILGTMSHPGAIRLAARLAELTPGPLSRTLFASDGASAVEAALKIALQYWVNVGRPERKEFVSLTDGYHGDTFGTMGVGFVPGFHDPFRHVLRPALRADCPHCFRCPAIPGTRSGDSPKTANSGHVPELPACDLRCFGSMEELVRENRDRVAAVIVEPMCMGAAGMRIYPAAYLARLRALCDDTETLLIADEIAVGFGRTGALFACEHAGVAPDILCLGKALTGGYLPMSATVVTDAIYDAFRSDNGRDRTLYHGHTFCGNPILSAAALAALDVYTDGATLPSAARAMEALRDGIARLAGRPQVEKTRTLGMIGVLEIGRDAGGSRAARAAAATALERGLFIRPLGPILYLWPPLTTTVRQIGRMVDLLGCAIGAAGASA